MTSMRVLLQFAGNRRNDPSLGEQRPGLRVARMRELGAVDHAFVLYTADDSTSKSHAEDLGAALGKGRRGGVKVSVEALPVRCAGGDPALREAVREGVDAFVTELLDRVLGARAAHAEFVVSALTGTVAQWTALVDALDARGARVGVVWDPDDQRLSIWRAPTEAVSVEPSIALLERAPVAWNVLLTGPTGVGKSEAARRLHDAWGRHLGRKGAFVAINAGALPRELIAAELFGAEKGAFTGATTPRAGAFMAASDGTLFLDEIGDLPLDLQVQLLTALDVDRVTRHRSVRALGAAKPRSADVRVVLGTNRDLHALCREGRFRLDLLGRISTHQLDLPPLASARHRIVGAYQQQLESLAGFYGPGRVRFAFERAARWRLLEFVFSPESRWSWNHRDVAQSAERLAMRAWARAPRRSEKAQAEVKILVEHVEQERALLTARWSSLGAQARAEEDAWSGVERRVQPGAWAAMSWVERWELRYLLEARDATQSKAEAWRWIAARNLLEGATDAASQRNPSNAFEKRWQRYRAGLLPGGE